MSFELRYGGNANDDTNPATALRFGPGEENDAIVRFAEAVVRLEADEEQEFAFVSLTLGGVNVLTWTQTGTERATAVGEDITPAPVAG